MAGDAIVGALRVILGMDTGTFEDDIKKATSSLGRFGKAAGTIAAGIQLQRVVEQAARAFFNLVPAALESADALGKASQKFGVPVEQLSALKFAADLSDVSLETLGKSFTILSKNMQTVAGGATNITAAAFNNLGISVKNADGTLRSSNEIFLDVAQSFSGMTDGATKTALAVAIFGRAGAELIPLLNQGRDGIKSLTEEAARLGLVITEKTAKSAENFNDNLKRLSKAQEGVILQILGSGGLIDAMERVSFRLVAAAGDAGQWKEVSDLLGRSLEVVATWVLVLAKAVDTLTLPVQALVGAFRKLAVGDFAGAWEALSSTLGRAVPNLRELYKLITGGQDDIDIWVQTVRTATDALSRLATIKFDPKGFSEKQTQLMEKFSESLAKISTETRVLRGDFDNLAPGFAAAAEQFKDLDGFGKTYGTTVASLTPLQAQLNQKLQEFRAAQITQENLLPWQLYDQEIKKLNATMAIGKLGVEAYEAAAFKAALKVAEAWGMAAQSIVSPMADAFKTLASMNKKYAGAAKALAIAEAIVNTYLGATKALGSGFPPFNFIAAAAVTAAGLANVAKIQATEFAQGGSFKIGGSGGVDSQLVQFKGTPGEMVDVRTPGQQRGGNATEVTIKGMGPDEIFNGRWLRGFVEALNQGERDGYRLVFAER